MKMSLPVGDGRALLLGKRLLIFDFDGTVADTTPMHAAAFTHVLAPYGIDVDYSRIAGLKTADAMRVCLVGSGLDFNDDQVLELVVAKQTRVREMIGDGLEPLPGVDEFLRRARPRYRLAMVTSGSTGTVGLALDKLGYRGWFDPLVCADDVVRAKPDPEGFTLAVQIAGVPPEAALVFEDSAAGFAAATGASLDFIDVIESPWAELTELLQ